MRKLESLILAAAAMRLLAPGVPAAHGLPARLTSQQAASSHAGTAFPSGGLLHGTVVSGNTPLPGATVTARNPLTGKSYSTVTDATGAWSLRIPGGRYQVRAELSGFASISHPAELTGTASEQVLDFELSIASDAELDKQQASANANPQHPVAQSSSAPEANARQGAGLPPVAANAGYTGDEVPILGQPGKVSPLAELDRQQDLQQAAQKANANTPGANSTAKPASSTLSNSAAFRNLNPILTHGSVYWDGTNSAANAEPFSLLGQPQDQPSSGTNHYGVTLSTAPMIPHLIQPSGKDNIYFGASGLRGSSPRDYYATVPTAAQRGGDFSATGLPPIYDPATGVQFQTSGVLNVIPQDRIASQATALLQYIPRPNLTQSSVVNNYNYHWLTTAQSSSDQADVRYSRTLGPAPVAFGSSHTRPKGPHQTININYSWSHSASDLANPFPRLWGKTATNVNSVWSSYTYSHHHLTASAGVGWYRSNARTLNSFTNTSVNPAFNAGIAIPNNVPYNYGLPGITLSSYAGIGEVQPRIAAWQSISTSPMLAWIHHRHNLRFGGQYQRNFYDYLSSPNATGHFTFTGLFTQNAAVAGSGSSIADFLLGLPQRTSLNSSLNKTYLRNQPWSLYAQDDWRALPNLTLSYGLRYEFFAPFTEKYGHLAMVVTNPAAGFTQLAEAAAGGINPITGARMPASLVSAWRRAFSPRLGLAYQLPRHTVVRTGFGMNFSGGQYSGFAGSMAAQPPFRNVQSNSASAGNTPSIACVQANACYTLANGFAPAGMTLGTYAIDPRYGLPYLMTWNLDVQKSLPFGIVMGVGYNGAKSNHLDVRLAPRQLPASPNTNPNSQLFNYGQNSGFYKMSGLAVRANKALTHGIALGANYQLAHAIDDATSINGSSGSLVQNWLDPGAEEGNSSFVRRNQVGGSYLYELPFGEGREWATSGVTKSLLEGFTISGSFNFASGGWLTPSVTPTAIGVTCGNGGAMRADRVSGEQAIIGRRQWINPGAYQQPTYTPGFCDAFGDAPRNGIEGPGIVQNNMALAKIARLGSTRSMELRATIGNVFNTVQYAGIDQAFGSPTFGEVSSVGGMRSFHFLARFQF